MTNRRYLSTRGQETGIEASKAIVNGIAKDGGLYIPESIPKMECTLDELAKMNYQEVAYEVMKHFFSDFTEEELKECIHKAYDEKFDTPEIAPVVRQHAKYYLELFHGPTIAFKDMALSILPHLMTTAAKKQQIREDIVILTATSGDTGKAALEGFANVKGTKIIVFYPKGGVSKVQELQMVTTEGDNTDVVAITGNFDDAQTGVKELFQDQELKGELAEKGYIFSSANSINIGRLFPQVAYYFFAYSRMVRDGEIQSGDVINVSVPTGNFGNILAAYYAKRMGLPLGKLICASNDNKVLFDFLKTGRYDKNREFMLTSSPSMDILVSSNLERLLYMMVGDDAARVSQCMKSLWTEGAYDLTEEEMKNVADFYGNFATEGETLKAIHDVHLKRNYILDPHTAVGYAVCKKYEEETGDKETKTLIASTASPYKFPLSVMKAIDARYEGYDEFDLIQELHRLSGVPIPNAVDGLDKKEVLHNRVCDPVDMKSCVKKILLGE